MCIVLCDLQLGKEYDPNAAGLDPEIRAESAQILMRAADALGVARSRNTVSKCPEPTGDELLANVAWSGDDGRKCD